MRKGFTLIELCIVLAIMAGMAALTVPSINRFIKRAEHIQRVNKVIEHEYKMQKESYEDGLTWDGDVWYTPFDVMPHSVDVDDERIVVQSFYIIKRKPCLTKPQQKP